MWGTPLERRHQTIRLRDRHWNPASIASFRRRRPDPYERNAAISWHFEHDPTPYALETDWPVGAAGFELLHLMRTRQDSPPRGRVSNLCISEFEFTETLSPGCRTRTCASRCGSWSGSAAQILMHRFESCRPSQAVCFQRVLKRTALETFPYGSFGYVDGMPLPDASGGALELC
jgi:hypothetical protein